MQSKTALITGCGRKRVGHIVAKHLASLGWNIAVHFNRSEAQAKKNAASYIETGVKAKTYQADVTDENCVKRLISEVTKDFGTIDGLVTTSSIWRSIPLEDVKAEDVLRSFRVNSLGTFLCCQHVGLQMTKQSTGGNIVTIGDSLTSHPYLNHAPYFAAKGSIASMTKALAVELASRNPNVRVNCIAPGPVMFPEGMSHEQAERVTESTLSKTANHPAVCRYSRRVFSDHADGNGRRAANRWRSECWTRTASEKRRWTWWLGHPLVALNGPSGHSNCGAALIPRIGKQSSRVHSIDFDNDVLRQRQALNRLIEFWNFNQFIGG